MPLEILPKSPSGEYLCLSNLNLYDSSDCQKLATQASEGRRLQVISSVRGNNAIKIRLCEDDYEAWLPAEKIGQLQPTETKYKAIAVSRAEIEPKLPQLIDFTKKAMQKPNYYLWGGTVAPNYDCSGLMQAAFASIGVWLPRDSYQQQAFTQKISLEELRSGDLIFFGQEKVNHVALHLGNLDYIHSSGKEMGNNGIGINKLCDGENEVNRNYYQIFWSCGRVISSYKKNSPKCNRKLWK
jgi:cell wall-associated NlpC family hydrolase